MHAEDICRVLLRRCCRGSLCLQSAGRLWTVQLCRGAAEDHPGSSQQQSARCPEHCSGSEVLEAISSRPHAAAMLMHACYKLNSHWL
jgi:hypothetical protein